MSTKPSDRQNILDAIAQANKQLARLRSEQKQAEATIQSFEALLENDMSEHDSKPCQREISLPIFTPKEKISLFRGLFRGREDVYPKLWLNKKTGKKGYTPACANEWVDGVCKKRAGVKCGKCATQSFVPVSNNIVLDHLQGRHTIGIYPMLHDDTCWFLAADFDKQAWKEDVTAFAETCRFFDVPYAIERSRSGNGAHVWFFFSNPILASTARKMGSYLITETMGRRHQLSLSSYDRLFPNQDTLPKGGFGNLIALPLQHDPRQEGNTVFLDDGLNTLPDQWSFLSSVQRISSSDVEKIAMKVSTQREILGMGDTETDDNSSTPWLRSPSHQPKPVIVTEPVPARIRGVISQRLFIEKTGLPSPLINQIKRLAAIQNPDFYKKQNLRLSTALTPRIIYRAEELSQHISLPRGCLDKVEALLEEYKSQLDLEDLRNIGEPISINFHGQLTQLQTQAVKAIIRHDSGVIVAPPGFGKTVLGTWLIAERKCNTLILVHRQPLLEQWKSQIGIFLDLNTKAIGQIGGGKKKPTGQIDVAMIQSLTKKEGADDMVANYGQVIIDECHHLAANSFERLISEVTARYVVGLTATPQRRDGLHPITHMHIGPIRFKASSKQLMTQRAFEYHLVVQETDYSLPEQTADIPIQEIYRLLVTDKKRNDLIINDVLSAIEEGRSPILLTERKDHLDLLHAQLTAFVRHIVVLKGGRSAKKRREVQEQLESIPIDEERLLLATGRYIGEGFDDARLDTLFLALPVAWKGVLVQYAGRLHRSHPGKHEVRIIDYVDSKVPMLESMFEKRLRGYHAMGYKENSIENNIRSLI